MLRARGTGQWSTQITPNREDVLEGIVPCLSAFIGDDVVPTVGLVDIDLTLKNGVNLVATEPDGQLLGRTHLLCHVVPVLGGMHTGLQRRSPRCGIHGRTFMPWTLEGLPVDEEGDGILRLRNAVVWLTSGNASSCAGYDARWDGLILHDPAVNVDVV